MATKNKDIPIIFVPDTSYLTDDGLICAEHVHVIADSVTYFKIVKLLGEKGGLVDEWDPQKECRISDSPAKT